MDLSILYLSFIVLTLISAGYFIFIQRQKIKLLNKELSELRGAGPDLFGKGKFSELGLMSAGIAHEISNPLTIIQGRITKLLRIYRDADKQKELAEGLQQIMYNSERIERTVKGMRTYFYQDDQLYDEDISLQELLNEVLVFCGQRIKNHGIDLRINHLEGIHIRGYRGQVEQAVLNLINNSFDAVDKLKDKWISISAINHEHSKFVQLVVKDSGEGIPQDVVKKMTDPFFTTKAAKGTGLGLTLVKSIAEKHGGALTYLNNSPNTTFILDLPKAELNMALGSSFSSLELH